LFDVWDCLKEDGLLIYSTCSFSKEENEDIVDKIFQEYSCYSVPLDPDPDWNVVGTKSDHASAFGYRFYPYNLKGEGYFLSVIQKKEAAPDGNRGIDFSRISKKDRNSVRIPKLVEQQLDSWIIENDVHYLSVGESIHALQKGLIHDFEILRNILYLKKAGIRVGRAGEKEWIPDHELALANILKEDAASMELKKQDALSFLRGEPIDMHPGEKGWRIARFGGQSLGWVKILEKRMNNYYPKFWRIRL
jgi:NOL1/NOP2/fmu family ribosome biogenesis protein